MRKLMILSAVMLSLLMLPAMASATHFISMDGGSDCLGYNASVGVHFRYLVDDMDLTYTVTLSDMNGMVLETITDSMVVAQGSERDIVLDFSGMWSVDATSADGFTVHGIFELVSEYSGGVDEDSIEFSNVLSCTVATEAVSFDSVKSLYR